MTGFLGLFKAVASIVLAGSTVARFRALAFAAGLTGA